MSTRIIIGDAAETLRSLPAEHVQCCVTSPPYFGLRDYGVAGQLGIEATPAEYVARLVEVFHEVRRVLRPDGVAFLNLGDSYAAAGFNRNGRSNSVIGGGPNGACKQRLVDVRRAIPAGAKPKDLLGIPWRVAFALQADGWWLRSAIVWHKPNPMPESVKDRPTNAYEHVFMLAKGGRYFFDAGAIAEPASDGARNSRNIQTWTSRPFRGAHFAVMPPAMAEWCIRAGSKPGDTVLDPFGGAETTAVAARGLGRNAVLIELSAEYAALAEARLGLAPSRQPIAAPVSVAEAHA